LLIGPRVVADFTFIFAMDLNLVLRNLVQIGCAQRGWPAHVLHSN
jgi:hypothetical protein